MPANTFKVGEMLNKRSPFSKTWMNFDGSYTTEIFNSQVHFEDEEGNLHNINTDLFDEADLEDYAGPIEKNGGTALRNAEERAKTAKKANKLNRDNFDFQGLNVPFEAKLPRNFKRGYEVGKGTNHLKFKPVGASPAKGHVDEGNKNCIQYQDAWNDADVILELTPNGIKETIIAKTDKAPSVYSFEVEGAIEDDLTAGEMKLAPAWLIDAAGERRDVSQTIRREGNKAFVDLNADLTGLVYPVEIDPTVTISEASIIGDAYTQSGTNAGVNNGSNVNLIIGNHANGTDIFRSHIKFDQSVIPAGSFISNASIWLKFWGYDGTVVAQLKAFRNAGEWLENTVTWNNQPAQIDDNNPISTLDGSTGVLSFDIKNSLQKQIDTGLNYGYSISEMSTAFGTAKYAYSKNKDAIADRPYMSITYNQPPTAPTVTSPDGGEMWNSSHAVTWTVSTDSETMQASLQYQIQLTTDNGGGWKDIVALTAAGATSYIYDFINEPETSMAKIRIRAYDGSIYGPWDESNGVFAIQHNAAPTAPTNLAPSGTVENATGNRLSWLHNDPNGTDPQSKFDLQWRLQGATVWNVVTQTTPNNYYDSPSNTFPIGTIEWQVRTYDQAGLSGPYSSVVAFSVANKPEMPTITEPVNGATVAIPRPVIQWSHPGQIEYKVEIWNPDETTLLWSDQKISTNKAVTAGIDLQNLESYRIKVSVKDSGGLWSNAAVSSISVSYTPPAKPTLALTPDNVMGTVLITISNPTPTGTQPAVSYNEVFRQETPSDMWVRIARVPANGSFIDYEPKPFNGTGYVVNSYGANGTYVESDGQYLSFGVGIENTQLMLVSDPRKLTTFIKGVKLDKRSKRESERTKFAGRPYPMSEFGSQRENDFDFTYLTTEKTDVHMIEYLADVGEVLLLRDDFGRKEYVTLDEVSISEGPTHWEISIKPEKVYYVEGI